MRKLIGTRLALAFVGLFVALSSLGGAVAQAATTGGQGLEISPPLLDLKADPGQTLNTQIKVRNVTSGTLVVRAAFEDFVANGEEGKPKILLAPGDKSPYSLKDWLNTPASLRLAPGQQQAVNLAINVPKSASPGGHYGLVRFSGIPPELEGSSGVSLSASVGTLLLVTVSGDIHESAQVAELYTSQQGHRRSLFEYGPVDITTRIQNTGNVHFEPKGTIQVTNMLGKNVLVSQFNQTGHNVLPGSIRKFDTSLNKRLLFGRFTVKADIVYGPDNQIADKKISFWVIPYKLIIIVLVALALLIFFIKRYNRHIVKKSQNKNTNANRTKRKFRRNRR